MMFLGVVGTLKKKKWKVLGLREEKSGFLVENIRIWGFWGLPFERPWEAFERQGQGENTASGHSNAPGRRSNAKAKPRGRSNAPLRRSNARAFFALFCYFASISSCMLLS